MKRLYIVTLCAGFLLFGACRSDKQKMEDAKHAEEVNDDRLSKEAEDDAQFIVDVANMNLEEIHLSELAYSKASMAETKEMAQMMLTDHRLALAQVTGLAQSKGVAIPTTPDAEATRKYDRLEDLEGSNFDKEYADMMQNAHKSAIDKFERISEKTEDGDVRNMVSAMLPTLRTHLEHAEHCQEMAKGDKSDDKTYK